MNPVTGAENRLLGSYSITCGYGIWIVGIGPVRPLVARTGRLHRLAVFEAAARLGTFTAAARELGMTQPAVTKHLRALEASLGLALFDRSANRATLTEAGRRLHESADLAFSSVESELDRIDAEDSVFVLAANPGVAQRWLVPYLDGLQEAVGEAGLRLWLFDREAEFAQGGFDAGIHAGDGRWPGLDSTLLFPEVVVPVAAPGVADEYGLHADSPADALLGVTLLHLDPTDRPWMSWAGWFTHQGLALPEPTRAVIYNNYALVLQEALAGRGVALAWRHLIDDWAAQGHLVPVGPEAHATSTGYHLAWPADRHTEAVKRLEAWLTDLVAADD
ncbi:MAG: LysR family transcriptional regulator [Acidimicrobiaceae bacterium]|nr:LysR family transcriptional regulator [Acidimicrobiaceae bacterium]